MIVFPGEERACGPANSREPTRNWSGRENEGCGSRSVDALTPERRNARSRPLLMAGPTPCATDIYGISSPRWTRSVPKNPARDLDSPSPRPGIQRPAAGDGKTSRSPGNHPIRSASGISGLGDPITGRGVAGPWGARDDEPRSEKRPSVSEPCSERPTSRVGAHVAPRSRSLRRRRTRPHGVSIAREEGARADARWRAALKPNLSSGGKGISSGKPAGPRGFPRLLPCAAARAPKGFGARGIPNGRRAVP